MNAAAFEIFQEFGHSPVLADSLKISVAGHLQLSRRNEIISPDIHPPENVV
jgi:hypothetical protein